MTENGKSEEMIIVNMFYIFRVIQKYFYKLWGKFFTQKGKKKFIYTYSLMQTRSMGPPKTITLCYMPSSRMSVVYVNQIKLLIENKLIICTLGNLHYKISINNLI